MVSRTICRAERVRLAYIALSASALAAVFLPVKFATPAEAKTPGSTYCYYGVCHRVKTIEETQALVGVEETITASNYDDCSKDRYNPCGLTSSGERFHPDRPDNTASPIYPDGTMLLVWSPETERALVVRVNNAGPYWGDRVLDLSRAAADKLGFSGKGVATLRVRVIKAPEPEEAAYVENRNYKPVPGDIGEYDSLQQAEYGMAVALALQASAASPLAPVTTANAFATGTENAEPLVAEAPQSLGRAHTQVAAIDPPSGLASLSLDGPDSSSSLFKGLFQQSHQAPQSTRQLASLSVSRELNQSTWREDRVEAEPVDEPVVAAKKPAQAETVATLEEEKPEKSAAPATADEQRKPQKAERVHARSDDEDVEEERATRRAEARGERRSRTAKAERRRSQPQIAFSEQGYERRPQRPERSAGQIMSLGIRAEASSTM